jgi:acyl-CoA thioesterase
MAELRMTDPAMAAKALAEATAQAMYTRGNASRFLGMSIVGVAPGHAVVRMDVREEMLNSHDMCHGGFIFALADSAFAFAANSYNIKTVTAGSSIDYLAPATVGDTLTAVAMEQQRSGKTGVYDVTVSKGDGTRIAMFRGKAQQIKGEILPSPIN